MMSYNKSTTHFKFQLMDITSDNISGECKNLNKLFLIAPVYFLVNLTTARIPAGANRKSLSLRY